MQKLLTLIALFSMAFGVPAATAGNHGLNLEDVAQFEILPGWRTKSGSHMTALRVRLAPGWKTYWRAPGEGGIPPRFDWERSENLSGVAFHWPAPDVFYQNGMRSVGFETELILPIELFPQRRNTGIAMRADLEIGVCEVVCIPVGVRIAADISGAGATDARILAAIQSQPTKARAAGMRAIACRIDPISDGLRLTARIQMPSVGPDEVTVFELPDQTIWVAEAVTERAGGTLTAMTEMVPTSGRPFALDRSQVKITVLSGGRAVEIDGCVG